LKKSSRDECSAAAKNKLKLYYIASKCGVFTYILLPLSSNYTAGKILMFIIE
jgi:hypothetical protein